MEELVEFVIEAIKKIKEGKTIGEAMLDKELFERLHEKLMNTIVLKKEGNPFDIIETELKNAKDVRQIVTIIATLSEIAAVDIMFESRFKLAESVLKEYLIKSLRKYSEGGSFIEAFADKNYYKKFHDELRKCSGDNFVDCIEKYIMNADDLRKVIAAYSVLVEAVVETAMITKLLSLIPSNLPEEEVDKNAS